MHLSLAILVHPRATDLAPSSLPYLEHALKEVRTVIGEPKSPLEEKIPREIAYADDVDFVGLEYIDIDAVQRTVHRYNLKVNIDKTEKKTSLSKKEDAWRSTKKVGSLMGDKEDVKRRKQLSNSAIYKLKNIWIGKDKINHNIKIKLYKALVKSILTYNCGTWALAQTELNKLDAFHRKQLRKVLNIYYPTKISNKTLYKKCNEKPLSNHILESGCRLFGHILRRNEGIPANKAMQLYYFHRTEKRFRGRSTTTLLVIINKDLSQIQDNLPLKSIDDLKYLRSLAQDRDQWKSLTKQIEEIAEASRSDDQDVKSE